MSDRPVGVTVIGILKIISGIVSFFLIFRPSKYTTGELELIFTISGIIITIFHILSAIGLLLLKEWARTLIILLSIIDIANTAQVGIRILLIDISTLIYFIITIAWTIIFNVVIIIYLMKEEIKSVFI